MLTAKDISKRLKISIASSYRFLNENDKSIRIGRSVRISEEDFEKSLSKMKGTKRAAQKRKEKKPSINDNIERILRTKKG